MHYLDYLAEKLVLKLEARGYGASRMDGQSEDVIKSVRSVLENEVEGGRLHYNTLHCGAGTSSPEQRKTPVVVSG